MIAYFPASQNQRTSERFECILQQMYKGCGEDDALLIRYQSGACRSTWRGSRPVPKCFPMKNTIRGMRRSELRFERVGKETAVEINHGFDKWYQR